MNLSFVVEVAVGGLLTGVMYSLVALGFVLIYKASGVFNYAQGSMVLFAALSFVGQIEAGCADLARRAADRRDHGGGGLCRGAPGAAAAGQSGADHPVHGHHRHIVLPRWVRPADLGQRRAHPEHRHSTGSDLRRRCADQRIRSDRRHCRGITGRGPGIVLPVYADRPRAPGSGRRSSGGDVGGDSARVDLGGGVVRGRHRGTGCRDHVGIETRRAVLRGAGRAEGASGTDPGRLHLHPRRHRRRA